MNFATHVKTIADKADELSALSQILPNVDGPKASKRKLLCSLSTMKKGKLQIADDASALRISSAYGTISNVAATVRARITPIDIKVQERTAVFNKQMTKTEAREISMEKWQTRWNKEVNGTWTKKLITNIKPWVLRGYGETNHTSSKGPGMCNRWTKYRICAENQMGKELRVENLIETMLDNEQY
ncbi:uncharacterized protein LOC135136624 [Zophobas morio]|uniref:uncharacterized protein LOC135136624 n=1 Tax=Zophobas morio TaxID=2755281 RepID=UPI0030826CF2